ncbi:hypothetical protein ACJJTC_012312 [Scirpophaga incertulas]
MHIDLSILLYFNRLIDKPCLLITSENTSFGATAEILRGAVPPEVAAGEAAQQADAVLCLARSTCVQFTTEMGQIFDKYSVFGIFGNFYSVVASEEFPETLSSRDDECWTVSETLVKQYNI